ncbi:MAG: amidase [Burkholderiaceae bacterium]|nr:amidase [Burkholderiaceae bacterium]
MASPYPESLRICLDRRKQIRERQPTELMAWAVATKTEIDAVLRGWVEFDEQATVTVGAEHGPLAGLPIGVKDVIDVAGMPTRAGSRSRDQMAPAVCDAEVVARLRAMGAVICGKTATTEFAYLDPSAVTNPFNAAHTPGGSSSGSAAVVGAGVVPLALGTQTAGSVCRPAAWCGTYAFKPSTGRTPRSGVEPFAPSFDTVGVFGLDLELTVRTALATIGERDAAEFARRVPSIVWLEDPYFLDISPDCMRQLEHARELLKAAGCRVRAVEVGLDFEQLRSVHRTVMHFEAYAHHGSLLRSHAELLGEHWRTALETGAQVTPLQAAEALQTLAAARDRLEAAVDDADLVLGSPVRTEALEGVQSTGDAGLIIPWTYAGTPLVVLPTGLSRTGMPLAVMLAGRRNKDRAAAEDALTVSSILRDGGMVIDA